MPIKKTIQKDIGSNMSFDANKAFISEVLDDMKNEESMFAKKIDRRVKSYFKNDPDMCKIT